MLCSSERVRNFGGTYLLYRQHRNVDTKRETSGNWRQGDVYCAGEQYTCKKYAHITSSFLNGYLTVKMEAIWSFETSDSHNYSFYVSNLKITGRVIWDVTTCSLVDRR
jgi:hypothetical protein